MLACRQDRPQRNVRGTVGASPPLCYRTFLSGLEASVRCVPGFDVGAGVIFP